MKIPRRAILFSLVLLLLLGLAFWKRVFFIACIIAPIARIFWLIYRTLQSVDQVIYWVLLVSTILSTIICMLPESKDFSSRPAYENPVQNHDRVLYWETLIKAAEGDQYDRLRLQRSLQTLSQSIEDLSCGNDPGVILLPTFKTGFQGWVQKVSILLPLSQYIQRKKVHSVSELEKCIDQILKSMEMQMESTHD